LQSINLRAHAKINFALDVLNKREDGYHNIKTIMQTLWLHDSILIQKVDKFPYKFVCDVRYVPIDDRNIINKAAKLIIQNYDVNGGIFIKLTKRIPIAAGLGGGSADCAATLVGLRRLFSLTMPNKELMEIGKSLGADVPFCIKRGTAIAEGIGDVLTPIANNGHDNSFIVLVRPPIYVSTKHIFEDFDISKISERSDFDGLVNSLSTGNVSGLSGRLCNQLEAVTIKKYPIIAEIKASLLKNGALGTLMSGSGPTVFGIFDNKHTAGNAIRNIRAQNQKIREIFLTTMYNPSLNHKSQITNHK